MNLLVTRPEPDAARTAAALRAQGHEVLLAPLTRIEPAAAAFGPGPWAAVLISSANAARAMEIHPRRQELIGLPALAVGDRSAVAARHAGFTDVASAAGTATELASLAAARYGASGRPLLYLAGADRTAELAAELAAAAVAVEICVVYQAVANPSLPPDVAQALRRGSIAGVLHLSRRAAQIYLDAAAAAGLGAQALAPKHFCLSGRIAEPLAAAGAPTIRVAAQPTEDSLLQLVDSA